MKNVLVAGSTGLIGKILTISLAKRGDCTVTALVRRQGDYFPTGVQQLTVDYDEGLQVFIPLLNF